MNDFDIPIFKKAYDLYKTFHDYRKVIPKHDRFTIFERSESALLEVIECIMQASGEHKKEKLPTLERASFKLNMLRVYIRLMKDVKTIDGKKYMTLESSIDEMGRMLGGWIRSVKVASTPNFIHPQTLVFQHLRDSFSIQGGNGVATF